MLSEQMSPRQFTSVREGPRNLPLKFGPDIGKCCWTNVTLESVLDVARNLLLKFHQNWVNNS